LKIKKREVMFDPFYIFFVIAIGFAIYGIDEAFFKIE